MELSVTLFLFLALLSAGTSDCHASTQITALTNFKMIPMITDQVIPGQVILIENGLISAVGPAETLPIPVGARVLDLMDQYLMPGLADMHAHYLSDYERDTFFNLLIKNGVTTVRLFQSSPNDSVFAWRDEIDSGRLFGPTLLTCGMVFNGPETPPEALLTTPRNYDFFKIYGDLKTDEFKKIMAVARKEKIYTIGHIPFLVGLDDFIREGMHEVAHISELDYELIDFSKDPTMGPMFGYVIATWFREFYESGLSPEAYILSKDDDMNRVVEKVRQSGITMNSTLIVSKLIREQLYEEEAFLRRPELKYMMNSFMTDYLAGENTYQKQVNALCDNFRDIMRGDNGNAFITTFYGMNQRWLQKLHDAGVVILPGTDTPAETVAVVPGYSLHEELRIMVENGFTPYEALYAGTRQAGETIDEMGAKYCIGAIVKGYQADFILTAKNPLDNIDNTRTIQAVMVRGQWLDRGALDALPLIMPTSLADDLRREI